MAKIVGNDVAQYQGDINFDIYRKNTNFLIVKTTEGVGFTDPKFKRNQSEARRTQIPLGYYHFARPDLNVDPTKEADWFLQTLRDLQDGEVLVLDYEPNWNGDAVGWCKKWLDYVTSKTSCKPLIYLNQNQLKTINWKLISDAGYGLWVAAYTLDPNNNNFITGSWSFAAMQQWTSSQLVPGIPTKVDGNVFFGDVATFKRYGYKKPIPTDPCESVKKQLTEAQLVIVTLTNQNTDLAGKLRQSEERLTHALERFEQIRALLP